MISLRLPLGRAHMLASALIHEARRASLEAESLTAVGSARRFAPDVGDVTLLVAAPMHRHRELLSGFGRLPLVVEVTSASDTEMTMKTSRGEVRLQLTVPEDAGAALVWHTGSREHVDELRLRAHQRQLVLDGARLTRSDGTHVPCVSEDALYGYLDLPFIPPELREVGDIVGVVDRQGLPRLLAAQDIKGDLHMHSTWSDGRDSIEEMVLAAQQLGYEYVAITDHSERAWSSRRLAAADVARQREEVEQLRRRFPQIHIFHGVEVDIMPDGSLDFGDDLLAGFDLVLASLHDHCGHDGTTLTERYLGAIHHPLVNVITHPANRTPAIFDGYPLAYDRLFAAAAETGTAMEIDGAPAHLDMDGVLARRAVAAGVTLIVSSDCHRAEALGRQMRFGIGTARRGWIEPGNVLNTRSGREVVDFVARKRGVDRR